MNTELRSAPTLTRHLLIWAFSSMLLLWAVFVYLGYQAGQHESDELTDGHLATVAALLLAHEESVGPHPAPLLGRPAINPFQSRAHEYQQSMSALIWNPSGALVSRVGPAPEVPFTTPDGFALLKLGADQQAWRSFTRWNVAHTQRITVLISDGERDALADDIAGQIGEPGWWLLPLMLLALGLAIHRGLKPLRELSSQVHGLEVQHPQALALKSPHAELRSAVDAINSLVGKYDQALGRERQLADAFAHELRTPLTALGLRIDQLRAHTDGTSAAQQSALQQVELEARRANQVLTHLLALARAGRASMDEGASAVDLADLARRLIADHVPAADAAGHELSYAGDEQAVVQGQPVLIEIALRNLLENAIAHAPARSQIEVRADAALRCLEVCDGPRVPAAADALPPPEDGEGKGIAFMGLGLGHQVIARVAEVHGGRFEEAEPPPGFRRCYRLLFP